MDIRVAAYSPVTVSTFSKAGSPTAVSYVQNAAKSAPVPAVNAIQQSRSSQAFNAANFATTEDRGTLVNILA